MELFLFTILEIGGYFQILSVRSYPALAIKPGKSRLSPALPKLQSITLPSCPSKQASKEKSIALHNLIVPSKLELLNQHPRLGSKDTEETSLECAGIVYAFSCFLKSQTFARLSSPPVTHKEFVTSTEIDVTPFECPFIVHRHLPDLRSHMRAYESNPVENNRLPSPLNAQS